LCRNRNPAAMNLNFSSTTRRRLAWRKPHGSLFGLVGNHEHSIS
jgi:hypothetical protein